ncbi:MAG TPA: S8 family serine peptidase, partial [Pyrinomonadaceae bacterium]
MKRRSAIPYVPRLVTRLILALFVCFCVGIVISDHTHASDNGAAQPQKIAKDLRRKIQSNGNERVKVIVQPNGAWNSDLDAVVTSSGGSIARGFKNFRHRVISLPAAAIENLANRADVAYIALDREVKMLGHVTLTTGTDVARTMTSGTTLNGAGVGIVVMDSGIDPDHVSFTNSAGQTRLVANVDFTGERDLLNNRITYDPYGHGTHVASLAAGNGVVAAGAYQGIAPAAKIINLRVLDSQGKGSVSALLNALDWVMTNRTNPNYNIRVVNMSL